MIIVDIEQGSEAWFKLKAGMISGTRFAKVMAGDSTATYKDLITDLAGEMITGEVEEVYSNAVMARGTDLEPEARALYCELIGEVTEAGFCLMDGMEDWVGVSPDGLTDKGIIEIKCPIRKTHINYIEKGALPSVYKWQVHGNMMATGAEYCDFMSYYPDMKPFIIRVEPDKELQEQLITEIHKTIKLVKLKIEMYNNYNYQ